MNSMLVLSNDAQLDTLAAVGILVLVVVARALHVMRDRQQNPQD